jgi:hypothetical protein
MSMIETGLKLRQAPLFAPPPEPSPVSQCGKILAALRTRRACDRAANVNPQAAGWIQMPDLVASSGSFNIHSRIDELRHRYGIQIENQIDQTTKPHKSQYRLI